MGSPSIVIAAGGTGGHIFPGLALAEAITELQPSTRLTFVGTAHGMERDIIPRSGHELRLYSGAQFNSQGWRKALVPGSLVRGAVQARGILKWVAADVAVTMGGYSGVPLVFGARLTGVPVILHEPGAVPGQANLLASRFTSHIATSFPGTRFGSRPVREVGYPLRAEIRSFDRAALRGEGRTTFGIPDGTSMVLVNGGSQGSLTLNRLALGLAERWAERDDVRIVLKPGARTHDEIAAGLESNPGRHLVDLVRHIERMDLAYAAADAGVHRAGAGTVAELATVGLPSILVPLPAHEHDEQGHNAKVLVDAGGGVLVRDPEATSDVVGPMLEAMLVPQELERMRTNLHAAAKPDAAAVLAGWVLDLAAHR
jgi:UDP-N-acetylglucosamine--N-acetylmuramyl-(pentapeptide) pyrophosphoryl-undecaprenol N-acetylglucosamine transferase